MFLTANGCPTEPLNTLTRAWSSLVLDQRTPSPLIHGFPSYCHGSCLITTDKRVRRHGLFFFSDELVILVGSRDLEAQEQDQKKKMDLPTAVKESGSRRTGPNFSLPSAVAPPGQHCSLAAMYSV